MKSNIITLIIFILGTNAYAGITQFNCSTNKTIEKNSATQFSFTISTTNAGKKVSYVNSNEDDAPVRMQPLDSVLMLNDNYLVKLTANGIELTSDGAGCQLTTVLLYKNSGFKSGYAQVKDTGCGVNAYSTVTCKTK